jgi:hypothetical protein
MLNLRNFEMSSSGVTTLPRRAPSQGHDNAGYSVAVAQFSVAAAALVVGALVCSLDDNKRALPPQTLLGFALVDVGSFGLGVALIHLVLVIHQVL